MSLLGRILPIAVGVAVVAAIGAYVVYGQQQQETKQRRARANQDQPAPVLVARASVADVPIYLDAVDNTRALNTVTVRPQVGGQIVKVAFKEGQDVQKGFVLAEIDPRTFQANYQQAVGKRAQDQALLATARANLERSQNLAPQGYISKQDLDTQRNQVSQYQAAVEADVAAIASAQVQLGFTKVISPIDGVTGIRGVDPGNLVTTTSTIVTITQLHPIYVMFTLPEQNLEMVRNAVRGSTDPLQVTALDRVDAHPIADGGELKVIDNQIDTTTGTFRLRSQFANEKNDLWPGQFVNVRLKVRTVAGGLVIPSQAVQRGPDGDYVYQVQGDSTVKMQPVKIAGEVGDSHVMIGSGLKEGDQIVTEGQFRLKPGSKVKGLKPGEVPAAPTAEELQQQSKKGQRNGGGRRGG